VIFKQHNQIYCIFSSIFVGLSDFFNIILKKFFGIEVEHLLNDTNLKF